MASCRAMDERMGSALRFEAMNNLAKRRAATKVKAHKGANERFMRRSFLTCWSNVVLLNHVICSGQLHVKSESFFKLWRSAVYW